MPSKISISNLNFYYGTVQALYDITLEIPEREIVAFVTREYWTVEATGDCGQKPKFKLKLNKIDGKKADIEIGKCLRLQVANLQKQKGANAGKVREHDDARGVLDAVERVAKIGGGLGQAGIGSE